MNTQRRNLIRRRNRLLNKLHVIGPLIEGSFVETHTKCGKSYCRCAKGPGHKVNFFTWKESGKTKTLYVSKKIHEDVENAWKSYLNLKRIIKDLSSVQVELFKLEGKEHGKRKKQQS
jgi:hypothetical protein